MKDLRNEIEEYVDTIDKLKEKVRKKTNEVNRLRKDMELMSKRITTKLSDAEILETLYVTFKETPFTASQALEKISVSTHLRVEMVIRNVQLNSTSSLGVKFIKPMLNKKNGRLTLKEAHVYASDRTPEQGTGKLYKIKKD